MIWATWRQHRAEALAGGAVMAGVTALVLGANSFDGFASGPTILATWVLVVLAALPAIAAVFVGAPLLSRDVEQRTHWLIWTQGTPRARWLAHKLLLVFVVVLAGAIAVGALVSVLVWSQYARHNVQPWLWFDMQGPAFVAYTAFGLGLGLAAGAVIGRSYPAMALTLVVFVAARALDAAVLRRHLLEPLRGTVTIVNGVLDTSIRLRDVWIVDLDYDRGILLYEPLDRFWLFQAMEAAIFVGLAALLVAVAVYWTTRRVR